MLELLDAELVKLAGSPRAKLGGYTPTQVAHPTAASGESRRVLVRESVKRPPLPSLDRVPSPFQQSATALPTSPSAC